MWSSSEINSNNAWNVNYNGNCNNDNVNNGNGVCPVLEIVIGLNRDYRKGNPYIFDTMDTLKLVNEYKFDDILGAFLDCRNGKRNSRAYQTFNINREERLYEMLDEINNNRYKIGRYTVFPVEYPKVREIWAPTFRDRILHHLLYNGIHQYLEKRFIADTYSCIVGRGTLKASQRLEQFCRSITQNWKIDAYYLQMDVANFFVSIDKQILWEQIVRYLGNDTLTTNLIYKNLMYDPTLNPYYKNKDRLHIVEPHKSLFNAPKGVGLPIGVLTSQFFSNVYMTDADMFAKHVLNARYYVRYVDDIVVLSRDARELENIYERYNQFLKDHLNIHIHPNKVSIGKITDSIDFVGRIINPFYCSARARIVNKSYESLSNLLRTPDRHAFDSTQSYIGMLKHTDTYSLRKDIISKATRLDIVDRHDYEKLVWLSD